MEDRSPDAAATPSRDGSLVVRRRTTSGDAPAPDAADASVPDAVGTADPVAEPAEPAGPAPAADGRDAPGGADDDAMPRRPVRSGWGPRTAAIAPHAGALAILTLVLAIAVVGLLIVLVGSTQPSVVGTSDPDVVDTFGGTDGSPLGDLPGGGEWELVGQWQVVAGTAFLSGRPDDGGRGFALLPGVDGTQRVAATLYGLADDGGVVARYQGPGDHIALTPVESLGTWRIDVVVGGEVVTTQGLGLIGVVEGQRAELVVRGTQAWAIVDGQVRGSLQVDAAPTAGQVGLVAGLDSGGSTRFDDVAHEPA